MTDTKTLAKITEELTEDIIQSLPDEFTKDNSDITDIANKIGEAETWEILNE